MGFVGETDVNEGRGTPDAVFCSAHRGSTRPTLRPASKRSRFPA
jgi:hypothetical protein